MASRIQPIEREHWPSELAFVVDALPKGQPIPNLFKVLAHHPSLVRRWSPFADYVLSGTTLAPRIRELLILRTSFRRKARYEWGHHVEIGRSIGMTELDLAAVSSSRWEHLSDCEKNVLKAADELFDDGAISEVTWRALSGDFNTRQMLDIVSTVGQYTLVAMLLNSTGVVAEPGLPGFDVAREAKV